MHQLEPCTAADVLFPQRYSLDPIPQIRFKSELLAQLRGHYVQGGGGGQRAKAQSVSRL
jgi:hypothetical protein